MLVFYRSRPSRYHVYSLALLTNLFFLGQKSANTEEFGYVRLLLVRSKQSKLQRNFPGTLEMTFMVL